MSPPDIGPACSRGGGEGWPRLLSQGLAPSAWTLGSCSWQCRLLALEWPQGRQEMVSREAWDWDSSLKGMSVGTASS